MRVFIPISFEKWLEVERCGYISKGTRVYTKLFDIKSDGVILVIDVSKRDLKFDKKRKKIFLKVNYILPFKGREVLKIDENNLVIPLWTFEGKKYVKLEEYVNFEQGWLNLLKKGIKKILEEVKIAGLENKFCFLQIKEKFGRLVIYTNEYVNDKIDDILIEIEKRSLETCYKCGNKAKIRDISGYFITLCDKCYNKELNKQKQK